MSLLDRLSELFGEDDGEERLASDPLVLDTGTAGAAPVVPEADELTAGDLRARAEEFAGRNEGAGLGFTLASLDRLDDLATDQPTVLARLGDDVPPEDRRGVEPGGRVLDFGTYMGEVLVAEFDGEWVDEDGWGVALAVDTEPVTVPVFDVAAGAVGGDPRFHEVAAALDGGEVPLSVERPTAGVRTAMGAAAEEVAAYWSALDLEFSPESLARLDDLVDEEWDAERFRDARFGDRDADSHVYTELVRHFGSYYGEVLVRGFDAEWTSDPELGTVVDVAGRDGTAVANVFVVAADRLTGEEVFALDFDVLAANLDLDAPPTSEHGYEVVRANPGALDAVRGRDPEVIADTLAEDAATLVGEFPDYGLDYTPASLGRLDRLVAAEFDHWDLAGAELEGATDADSLVLTARATEAGGYLAEVFRREFGGAWRPGDLEFVVEGRRSTATLEPVGIAARCLRGDGSFAATYRAIDDALDPPDEAGEEPSDGDPVAATANGEPAAADAGAAAATADGDATAAAATVADADGPPTADRAPPAADEATAAGSDPPAADEATAAGSDPPAADEATAAGESATDEATTGDAPAERRRERADALAAEWPAYDLNGSVRSLVRLDALVEAEYDRSDGERDPGADPLAVPEDVAVVDDARAFGAYFGTLLCRRHGATWDGDAVAVEGPAGRVELSPDRVAAGCFAGASSFLAAYAHVAARAGLETPLDDG